MAKFDPYYKWLGIPPKDQPPNHYRLLGIDLFEEDPDVIEAAADRCMAFVQQCALGEHLKASQRILNELSAARVCLLVSEQKEKYDKELRAKIKPAEPESTYMDSWSEEVENHEIYDQVIHNQDALNLRPRRLRSRQKKTSPKARPFHTDPRFIWGSAGVIVLLLLAFTISSFLPGQNATSEPLNQVASSDQSELNESVPEEPAKLLPQSPKSEDQPEPVQKQKADVKPKNTLQSLTAPKSEMKPKSAVPESPKLRVAPLNAKKTKAKEMEWLPVEDLIASFDRMTMHTGPVRESLKGRKKTNSAEGNKAKPGEPGYDPNKQRATGIADGMGGSGVSAMAGLTFGELPDESELMTGTEGGIGMTGPVREGRGVRFAAVRGVFDLSTQQDKLERSLGNAFYFKNMQTGNILEFLDFQLQRKKAIPGGDPWGGEWKDVDIETSIKILKECADFDPEVVNSGITDRVLTMPLPSRIAGSWYKVATHPRVEYFTLSEEEIEQELEFNRRILDQYKNTHLNERVFKEKQKGFSTVQLDMRGMRSELMYGGRGASEMESVMQGMTDSKLQKLKANMTVAGRLLLFRYFDFDIIPGETYKYRVRLIVRNPNYQRPLDEVVLPAVAEGETRRTPWSNETAAVTAEEDVHFYLLNVDPPYGIAGTTASFEIYQWYPTTGTTIHSVLKTSIGEEIGGEQVVELYDVAKEEYDEEARVEFDTQNYLVDAIFAPTIRSEEHPDLKLRRRRRHQPIAPEAVIVDNFGNLKRSLPPAFSSSYADVKMKFRHERDSLTWVKKAAEARTTAPAESRSKKNKRKKNPIRVGL
ncbi:hypothetical protein [Gimesia algae]|uniref:Uncharacterized protein n=1 Tax=Gimesia algae TaxID=2527971 RepID=A0A517VHL9_9PLAN|nr:hypothetical protein [Gimesia algae]QDT92516.1 hypothetical protein Pan161_41840 [Gimesia algae]